MDLEAARALVPGWVLPTAIAVHACVAFLLTFSLCAFLFRLVRRADALRARWPVRARAIYPARAALLVASLALPVALAVAGWRTSGNVLLGGAALVPLAAALGSAAAAHFWRRRLARLLDAAAWTARRAMAVAATRALVIYPHLLLMLAVAVAMPRRFGVAGAGLLAASMVALFWLARGGGFRVACALGLAPDAPPEIANDLHAAASGSGIPLAGIHVLELPEVNAYALPFAGRIGFTRPALQKLERASLLAIGQHEIAHLGEPARARRTRVAAVFALAPLLLVKPLAATAGLTAVLLAVLLVLLLARLVLRPLRSLETRADEAAREGERERHAYAYALAETYRLNLVPAVFRGTIHPHLYDRLVALGAPPAYPRPEPPSRALGLGLMCLVVVAAIVIAAWGALAAAFLEDRPWVAVALDGGRARDAGALALREHAAGRFDEAATLYGAAAQLDRRRPHWPAYRSMSLAASGRVDEAFEAFLDATERAKHWPGACADILAEAQLRIDTQRRR